MGEAGRKIYASAPTTISTWSCHSRYQPFFGAELAKRRREVSRKQSKTATWPYFYYARPAVAAKIGETKAQCPELEFKDKNVLLVDDSIVRGTTCEQIIEMAREAGAKKVYFASAAPAVRYPTSRHRHARQNRLCSRTIAAPRKSPKKSVPTGWLPRPRRLGSGLP